MRTKMKKILKGDIPNELYYSRVMIYGAGSLCEKVIHLLKSYRINVYYIIDDDMNKCGSKIDDIEIISYMKFKEMYGQFHDICVVMTTIYGKTVLRQLDEIGEINIYELYDWLDELYGLNTLVDGVNDRDKIKKFQEECVLLKSKLADEESQRVLDGLGAYFETKDSNIISDICTECEQYFIPEVLEAIHGPLALVDGGGYTGEIYRVIEKYNIELMYWYCFEPDVDNYQKNDTAFKQRCMDKKRICINKGLWKEEGVLYFDGGKGTLSKIVNYKTDNQIEVISLDKYFEDKHYNFIKMDIEGAEYPALCGGIETIKRDRPILAISIYHSLEDYYKIPNYLMGKLQDYKYYIRHHALILCETVLYAIPDELLDECNNV